MGDLLMPNVTWSLTGDGMDILERAGLAGLYLTLTAAKEWAEMGDPKALELSGILKWRLQDKTVELRWDGPDLPVLTKLVEWAWQIRDGIYYLPGIHRGVDMREHGFLRIHTHSGLLGTFLQVGRTYRPKHETYVPVLIPFDEDDPRKTIALRYRPIRKGEHIRQTGALKKTIVPLKDGKKGLFRTVTLAGWAYPGSAKRFGKSDQNWTGTTDKAFLLLFSPIACSYLRLPDSRTKKMARDMNQAVTSISAESVLSVKGKRTLRDNWALVIPAITSLHEVAHKYRGLQERLQRGIDDLKVLGPSDAALRFATAYSGKMALRGFHSFMIHVVAMGVTDYYSSNPKTVDMIRKNVVQLAPKTVSINRYRLIMKWLPNVPNPVEQKESNEGETGDPQENGIQERATHWLRKPVARGRIAENLVSGEPWYASLFWPPHWQIDELTEQMERRGKVEQESISLEHLWFNNLEKDRRGLMELIKEESMWDSPDEHAFVTLFHNTLRRLLDKEEDAALSRGGSRTLKERWEKNCVDKIRRNLMRAKTLMLTRKLLMELLAEGGWSRDLTENKEMIWRLVNHPQNWKKARDLALLALVTFTDGRLGKRDGGMQRGGESNE